VSHRALLRANRHAEIGLHPRDDRLGARARSEDLSDAERLQSGYVGRRNDAASAEAALALAVQQPLSLITLDIMLPNMDGWEFLSRLKQVPALGRIPVVIISIVADRNKGFAFGAAAVMQKPLSRQELSDSLIELGLFPAGGKALKVLVVDDDPKAVELVAVHLQGLATSVLRAQGGAEAIDIAQKELPDLIILDLMMPDVSGFEVVEALHRQPGTSRIPIMIVTAKQITGDDRTLLNGYVSTIVEKGKFGADSIGEFAP